MSEDIKSLSDLDVVSSEDTAAVEVAAPVSYTHLTLPTNREV